MTRAAKVLSGMLALTAVAGCSSTKVLETSPGEYLVSATGTSPAFTGTENAIQKAHVKAEEHCTAEGLVVETINLDIVEQALGRPGRATLRFRCVESGQ